SRALSINSGNGMKMTAVVAFGHLKRKRLCCTVYEEWVLVGLSLNKTKSGRGLPLFLSRLLHRFVDNEACQNVGLFILEPNLTK
ncbi:hypothetical protein, partial [Enterovibrio nigricans]|uniref:hypothetical protein n=1 Tax=Enterovibrio nigricans TaxID=504469 RepID=UPI001BB00833